MWENGASSPHLKRGPSGFTGLAKIKSSQRRFRSGFEETGANRQGLLHHDCVVAVATPAQTRMLPLARLDQMATLARVSRELTLEAASA